ncbi:Helix-turn-helix domain-containing protein [Bradyrhizobium brasilense]|uniref:Helix-turn-helix domain-containing protein n=1 Tax=Bradyrhizobium brasilense TaxID=1419277 RepID=A0A1G6L5Z6_9BRAD|nr:helix-turn-helix domain-containing protein [Bradyrhizobium brasilense]SDC38597.1 Helix-turn-helix domain-containing protein [Bradyrhizobium brasilense]
MSIQAVAWALEQQIRDPWTKLILISLANHADHTTGLCWPSMGLIGREASCRRETVLRKLPELEAAGFIEIIRAAKGDRRRVHTYRLLLPGCAPHAHQIAKTRRAGGARAVVRPAHNRCEPAITTTNHQRTVIPSLKSLPSRDERAKEAFQGDGGEAGASQPRDRSDDGAVQLQIADAIGDRGWSLLMALPSDEVGQLVAKFRTGALDRATLNELRLRAMSV